MMDEILEALDKNWRELDELVARLSPPDFGISVPSADVNEETRRRWTIGDALVHIGAWKRNSAAASEAAERSEKPVDHFPAAILGIDVSRFNDELLEKWEGASPEEIRNEHSSAHELLITAVRRVPPKLLWVEEADKRRRPVLWLTPGLGHTRQHLEDIRGALMGRGKPDPQ